jgi:DNA ligase-associated metallophosphoesterase
MPETTPSIAAATVTLHLNGTSLIADPSGALFWPEQRTLIVADLHLEKGSSFARHGVLLPPYDTRVTAERLSAVAQRHGAERIVCLGDSFHDGTAHERLDPADALFLSRLVAGHEWIWVAGNHDPAPPAEFGGRVTDALTLGPLVFRHAAISGAASGELSGHFHPTAKIVLRTGCLVARCFVADAQRIVLPAFGAFTGGLDVFDPAITRLFPQGFRVHALARGRVVTMGTERLAPSSYRGLSHTIDRGPLTLRAIGPRRG